MTLHELRQNFLAHMERHGHVVIPSASLVPDNDPTTLFTGSGMQPMLSYLLGQPHPLGVRIADSQKCFRSGDIEEVGDNRHTTFFEMLGNWSLGDYFQEKQIPMMWEFLTQELKLDPKNLYFTCFGGNEALGIPRDTLSAQLWQKELAKVGIDANIVADSEVKGMQGGRIFYYGEKKNWWSRSGVPSNMPVGEPGGPDTEMFYDFGVERGLHEGSAWKDLPCHVNCDCGRFVEIGNNVFMAYQKMADHSFQKLPKQNVDFGAGLERMLMAVRQDPDIFLIDVFDAPRATLAQISGKKYLDSPEITKAYRVILDHLRAATMLVADGVLPSNKDQGYFVRRLLRRSVRFGRVLGLEENFTGKLARSFVISYGVAYPNVKEREEIVVRALDDEEAKFRRTLEKGMKEFEKRAASAGTLSGEAVFELFATYGFPVELTEELALERGITIDRVAFEQAKKDHASLSRTASAGKFKGGLGDTSDMSVKYHTATHLLHQALREVLGSHVEQRGSNITPERLRFDFVHPAKMTPEEIALTEKIVNEVIAKNLTVSHQDVSLEEARKMGAIGVFEDKYGEVVRVYSVGDFSKEFCGGPHVAHTGGMGHFRITKEEACSAGIRRIKAVLG